MLASLNFSVKCSDKNKPLGIPLAISFMLIHLPSKYPRFPKNIHGEETDCIHTAISTNKDCQHHIDFSSLQGRWKQSFRKRWFQALGGNHCAALCSEKHKLNFRFKTCLKEREIVCSVLNSADQLYRSDLKLL